LHRRCNRGHLDDCDSRGIRNQCHVCDQFTHSHRPFGLFNFAADAVVILLLRHLTIKHT
jgi:hypothetical protein